MTERNVDSVAADHDKHVAVCTERYGNINQQLLTIHARLDGISSRMWAAAGATVVMAIAAVGALALIAFGGHH